MTCGETPRYGLECDSTDQQVMLAVEVFRVNKPDRLGQSWPIHMRHLLLDQESLSVHLVRKLDCAKGMSQRDGT